MSVHILGGYQTDFAIKWKDRGESPLKEMMAEASLGALEAAGVSADEVGTAHVGNFIGERTTGQAQLGGVVPMIDPAWSGLPTARHEAACASGSIGALAAAAEIEAGRYDVALVIGAEFMRGGSGLEAAVHLGSAAWAPTELNAEVLPWPDLFDRVATEYGNRYGLDESYLGRIASLARDNAKSNPCAQTRGWAATDGEFDRRDDTNPILAGRTRRTDCGLVTDGAAAVVLASDAFMERWNARRSAKDAKSSLVTGWGHRTAPIPVADKFALSSDASHLFPHVRRAIMDARERAGVAGIDDIDVVETHDCFTISEYVAIDHFGITDAGESWKAVEDGSIERGGRIPVNPSGGLLAAGHPVGATGVRMLLDVHRQVTGTAGDCQVEGARRAASLNIGGTFTTAVSFVVESA